MKKLAILCTALAVTIGGCKTEQSQSGQSTGSTPEPAKTVVVKAPNGRWFSNPLHCSGKLPISGTYDFSVADNTLTYIGIGDIGTWLDDSKNEQAKKAFSNTLSADGSCLGTASLADFEMVRFVGKVTEYWFAYSEKNQLLLRYNAGTVDIIVPFDIEKIKKLELQESDDVLMPLEEVAPTEAPKEG